MIAQKMGFYQCIRKDKPLHLQDSYGMITEYRDIP